MKRLLAVNIAIVAALLAILLLATMPSDFGRYGETFKQYGLPGFSTMPSVLACEIWLLIAFGILLPLGLRAAYTQGRSGTHRLLKVSTVCAILGSLLYSLGVLGVAWAARAGQFGNGVAGLFALILIVPGFLLLVVAACSLISGYAVLAAG